MREMNLLFLEPEVPENVNGSDVSQNTVLTKRHYNLWGIRMNGMEVVFVLFTILSLICQVGCPPSTTPKTLQAMWEPGGWGGLGVIRKPDHTVINNGAFCPRYSTRLLADKAVIGMQD